MAWKDYTVRINNNPSLGAITQDVIEGIWDGNGAQGNYPALNNLNYLNLEIDEISGSVIYSANASIGTPKKDTVFTLLRVMGNMTINEGVTVTTPARKLGLAILVNGDCTINGTLTMTARGANHNGSNITEATTPNSADSGFLTTYPGRVIRLFSGNLNLVSLSGTTATVGGGVSNIALPDQGTAGGLSPGIRGTDAFNASLATGGGGSGGSGSGTVGASSGVGGLGATGSTFSGGTGGGGGSGSIGTTGTPNGGRGGSSEVNSGGGPGAGNPGGSNGTANSQSGTGGLLILFVIGSLTIGASGKVLSRRSKGGDANSLNVNAGGGGSGGGVICIAANTYALTAGYEISVAGGSGGSSFRQVGGGGGNGSVNLYKLGT